MKFAKYSSGAWCAECFFWQVVKFSPRGIEFVTNSEESISKELMNKLLKLSKENKKLPSQLEIKKGKRES